MKRVLSKDKEPIDETHTLPLFRKFPDCPGSHAGNQRFGVETISLRHAMEGSLPEETHFFSLMNWNVMNDQESTLSMYLVDEERVGALKEAIREHTDGFKKVKGAMFTKKIEDYEGTI